MLWIRFSILFDFSLGRDSLLSSFKTSGSGPHALINASGINAARYIKNELFQLLAPITPLSCCATTANPLLASITHPITFVLCGSLNERIIRLFLIPISPVLAPVITLDAIRIAKLFLNNTSRIPPAAKRQSPSFMVETNLIFFPTNAPASMTKIMEISAGNVDTCIINVSSISGKLWAIRCKRGFTQAFAERKQHSDNIATVFLCRWYLFYS